MTYRDQRSILHGTHGVQTCGFHSEGTGGDQDRDPGTNYVVVGPVPVPVPVGGTLQITTTTNTSSKPRGCSRDSSPWRVVVACRWRSASGVRRARAVACAAVVVHSASMALAFV